MFSDGTTPHGDESLQSDSGHYNGLFRRFQNCPEELGLPVAPGQTGTGLSPAFIVSRTNATDLRQTSSATENRATVLAGRRRLVSLSNSPSEAGGEGRSVSSEQNVSEPNAQALTPSSSSEMPRCLSLSSSTSAALVSSMSYPSLFTPTMASFDDLQTLSLPDSPVQTPDSLPKKSTEDLIQRVHQNRLQQPQPTNLWHVDHGDVGGDDSYHNVFRFPELPVHSPSQFCKPEYILLDRSQRNNLDQFQDLTRHFSVNVHNYNALSSFVSSYASATQISCSSGSSPLVISGERRAADQDAPPPYVPDVPEPCPLLNSTFAVPALAETRTIAQSPSRYASLSQMNLDALETPPATPTVPLAESHIPQPPSVVFDFPNSASFGELEVPATTPLQALRTHGQAGTGFRESAESNVFQQGSQQQMAPVGKTAPCSSLAGLSIILPAQYTPMATQMQDLDLGQASPLACSLADSDQGSSVFSQHTHSPRSASCHRASFDNFLIPATHLSHIYPENGLADYDTAEIESRDVVASSLFGLSADRPRIPRKRQRLGGLSLDYMGSEPRSAGLEAEEFFPDVEITDNLLADVFEELLTERGPNAGGTAGVMTFVTTNADVLSLLDAPPSIVSPGVEADQVSEGFDNAYGSSSELPDWDMSSEGSSLVQRGPDTHEMPVSYLEGNSLEGPVGVMEVANVLAEEQSRTMPLPTSVASTQARCVQKELVVKEELRSKILRQRMDRGEGLPEPETSQLPLNPPGLTAAEQAKRSVRRAQNRGAAKRHREKTKDKHETMKTQYQRNKETNRGLREAVAKLGEEVFQLRQEVELHRGCGDSRLLSVCLPQAEVDSRGCEKRDFHCQEEESDDDTKQDN